jgi:hypothetical protein
MNKQLEINSRISQLVYEISNYFHNKTYSKYPSDQVNLYVNQESTSLTITAHKANVFECSLTVPTPFIENNLLFIETNGTKRALGSFYAPVNHKEYDYIDVLWSLFLDYDGGVISSYFSKYGAFVKKIANSFEFDNTNVIMKVMQRIITDITTRMPVHVTNMNSWAMNHRVQIIDPHFDSITSPAEKLNYQEMKSEFFFDKGWTSIGLSDGVLADKNYILKTNIANLSPFAIKHHNPQRNLYSTLGMIGDERPLVISESMAKLEELGIYRTGWNLFTVFVDIPEVWEDQIIVDKSLCNKYVDRTKVYQCFGNIEVQVNQTIEKGDVLSTNELEDVVVVNIIADKMWVDSITKEVTSIGGSLHEVYNIAVKYRRYIKDATKITNLAANKGVVRVKDLGYATNPVTGQKEKIEVLVSAKSTEKRKNFTQIIEAIANNINNNKRKVYSDDIEVTQEIMEEGLVKSGFNKDGCWECDTYAGKIRGVAGKVFWGVTKDAEDGVWDTKKPMLTDNMGIRKSGLKLSSVEFRALNTRFGKDNAIVKEIISHAQGTDNVMELLKILHSKEGMAISDTHISYASLKPIDQTNSILLHKNDLLGTVGDENLLPKGFMLELPVTYQINMDKSGKVIKEGIPTDVSCSAEITNSININKIYVPYITLRLCWKHPVGKYGLSELTRHINSIIEMSHKHVSDPENYKVYYLLISSIYNYFSTCSSMLCSKKGVIANHSMSVRYPYSAKGVATLSCELPKNTIEIHKSMAKRLGINTGDVVLVERFPCLGFMSIRPQMVKITKDPLCRYSIRVSGNSLGSAGLDFDGDIIYIAKLYSKSANELLMKEWKNPNKSCYDEIVRLNNKAGKPTFREFCLSDYKIHKFDKLNRETHRSVVSKATGVKANTGPVTALAYNIMRIVENSTLSKNQKINVAVEVFLDKVANSVFKQKHGIKSLHSIVVEAICKADVETLVDEGFKRGTSTMLCDLIKDKAKEIGIDDLNVFYENSNSNIISSIVRKQNKVYFCSRSNIEGTLLLKYLQTPAVDLPSKIMHQIITRNVNQGVLNEKD